MSESKPATGKEELDTFVDLLAALLADEAKTRDRETQPPPMTVRNVAATPVAEIVPEEQAPPPPQEPVASPAPAPPAILPGSLPTASNTPSRQRPRLTGIESEAVKGQLSQLRGLVSGLESQLHDPNKLVRLLLPAIAEALRETLRQRRGEIVNALGSDMEAAIAEQIALERDAILAALQPVVEAVIAEYLSETVRAMNATVSRSLGLVPSETTAAHRRSLAICAVALMHRASETAIAIARPPGEKPWSAEERAGILTSVRGAAPHLAFSAAPVLIRDSGPYKILLASGDRCYLAAIATTEPPPAYQQQLQQALAQICQRYDRAIATFAGDATAIPPALQETLATLTRVGGADETRSSRRSRKLLVGCIAILGTLGLSLAGVGRHLAHQVERAIATTPSLSTYDLEAGIWGTTAYLTGTLPSDRLRHEAQTVARQALPGFLTLEDATAVAPRDPAEIAAEIRRLLAAANRSDGVELVGRYEEGTVTLSGQVTRLTDREEMMRALVADLEAIPGVATIRSTARIEPAHIATRLYFSPNSSEVPPRDISGKILPLESLLIQNPSLQIRIVGYRHPTERALAPSGRLLALERALEVQHILADRGIDRRRLEAIAQEGLPPDIAPDGDPWLGRCVLFEIVRDDSERQALPKQNG